MHTKMMKSRISNRLSRGAMMLSLAFLPLLTSCLDDDDSKLESVPVAYVSFYHGSPSTSGLSIEVDNRLYNTNSFRYSTYFDYGNFYTGERTFTFKSVNAANTLLDTTVTFEPDMAYSFFISEGDEGFVPVIVEDELKTPAEGKALVRLVHLSPDAPAVNLQIEGEENELFTDQEYRKVTDFKEIEAGRLGLVLSSATGSEDLVTAENVHINEGRIYTLVLRGYVDAASGSSDRLSLQVVRNYPNY